MTDQPDLFGGALPTSPEPDPTLGHDARRTLRQKQQLERGTHPATGLALLQAGQTCGDCAHLWRKRTAGWEGYKCELTARHHKDGPDIRRWWPACTAYARREDDQ